VYFLLRVNVAMVHAHAASASTQKVLYDVNEKVKCANKTSIICKPM